MQGWVQWLIYILAGLGALVVFCTIGALIYWVITIIKGKIEDYKDRYLKYEDFYFKYERNYLKYEDYYLTHKGNEYISEKEVNLFFIRLDTGEEYAFEIGHNLEKYTISGGCLYDVKGTYLGKIENIIFRGNKNDIKRAVEKVKGKY